LLKQQLILVLVVMHAHHITIAAYHCCLLMSALSGLYISQDPDQDSYYVFYLWMAIECALYVPFNRFSNAFTPQRVISYYCVTSAQIS